VCSTDPKSGVRLEPGKTVTLFTALPQTTSTTAATVQVPGVAGDTTNQACTAMVSAHLVCGTNNPTPSNLAVGTVVSTSPAAGTFQPTGTTINFNVSSGPSTVTVMNVVGDTQAQATSALEGQGLTVVVNCAAPPVNTTTTTAPAASTVYGQTPQGGQSVNVPSSVTISVVPDGSGNCTGT
jgi:beta-lactam-binding protein with PASTA domain